MEVSRAQSTVAKYRDADRQLFWATIGWLIDALLHESGDQEWCGKFPSFVDGVLFEHESTGPDRFVGQGTAVIGPEQYVEPLLVDLAFDPLSNEIISAVIRFGMRESTKPICGSQKARKIAQSALAVAVSARPKLRIEWRLCFRFTDGNWSSEISK